MTLLLDKSVCELSILLSQAVVQSVRKEGSRQACKFIVTDSLVNC